MQATRSASEEQLLRLAAARLQRLLEEGVTTIEIKSGYGLSTESEAKMLRVARQLAQNFPIEVSATLLAAHTTPAEYQNDKDGYITLICETLLPQLWQEGLFEAVDVFCESVGFSPQQCERVFAAARRYGIPVKGHVEQLSLLDGAQLVSRYQGLSADHIEYLDEEGVKRCAPAVRWRCCYPAPGIFEGKPAATGRAAAPAWCANSGGDRLQPRHQPLRQPASGDEYGLRSVRPDAGRGPGGRDASCGAGAGA